MFFDLQKASLSKRISAFLFDIIIFFVVAAGVAAFLSFALGYDATEQRIEKIYLKYEEKYEIDLHISDEDYAKLDETEKNKYVEAAKEFEKDKEVLALRAIRFNLIFTITSISLLIAFILLEFVLPLIFKNGQTMGKKMFGLAVMRTDGVRVSPVQLFVRSILGKYTIETMVPLLLLVMILVANAGIFGLIAIVLLFILQMIMICITKTNSLIHDLLAVTVVVDYSSQMIFDSTDHLIEYKKKRAEEISRHQEY